MHVWHNIEARSCNQSCSGKTMTITCFECVLLAQGIQHAMSMRHIFIRSLSGSKIFFQIWCMCVRASYMELTRDTHLMRQFIYYYKQLYMFRASICPSSGVLGCILIILLHMVSSTRCCGWGSEEPVCSLVHWCKFFIRPAGHTHHRSKITLPNTDQAHDKISVSNHE